MVLFENECVTIYSCPYHYIPMFVNMYGPHRYSIIACHNKLFLLSCGCSTNGNFCSGITDPSCISPFHPSDKKDMGSAFVAITISFSNAKKLKNHKFNFIKYAYFDMPASTSRPTRNLSSREGIPVSPMTLFTMSVEDVGVRVFESTKS